MLKVLSVIGARPQFIKASVTLRALAEAGCESLLVHTGQHYDSQMSDIFFTELDLPTPKIDLEVGSASHALQTALILERLEPVLLAEKPDWVLIYGDTNSTLAAALAAAKLHFPIAHVEAGLRSRNRAMPEEVNRAVADHLSDLLFAPSQLAMANLVREGLVDRQIQLVGDVMYDAALAFGKLAERVSDVLLHWGLSSQGYALATVHRAENTDDPQRLAAILRGLSLLAAETPVVVSLHPRTRRALEGVDISAKGLLVVEPVGYLNMVMLERNALVIVTDSGGVQKEAFFHRVPCVTLRTETEWAELVAMGWNRLVPPTDAEAVRRAIKEAIGTSGEEGEPYGDGMAAFRIAAALSASSNPNLPDTEVTPE